MDNTEPTYYAVIPANVRYDKNLKANEKLLYGEIACLSNSKGYCFSSNNYFAELYGVTPQAVSSWVSNLEKCGYVKCEYLHNGTEIKERRIRIAEPTYSLKDEQGKSTKVEKGINKKLKGYQQKIKDNITSNNTTSVNTTSIAEGSDYQEVTKVYFDNFKKLYDSGKVKTEKPFFSARSGKAIKDVLSKLPKENVVTVLNNAMNDNWIVEQGYTLTTILSESQINKLLNARPQQKPQYKNFDKQSLADKDFFSQQ